MIRFVDDCYACFQLVHQEFKGSRKVGAILHHHRHHEAYRKIHAFPTELLPEGKLDRVVLVFVPFTDRLLHLDQSRRRCFGAKSFNLFDRRIRHIRVVRQAGIRDDHAIETIGMINHQTQTYQTAPILTKKCNAREIVRL